MSFPKVSLTDAATGKRVRITRFKRGDAVVPVPQPQPILGYTYHRGHLTVYVNGPMPPALRSAREENRLDEEVLLVAELPEGIQEIDLTDCRREFWLQQAA